MIFFFLWFNNHQYLCFDFYLSLKVCVYLNKYGKVGPHLDLRRVQQLPDHFGPGRASSVLQQCVQACVDSAHNQATVFSCLKSGQGGEVISGESLTRKGKYFHSFQFLFWSFIVFFCFVFLFSVPFPSILKHLTCSTASWGLTGSSLEYKSSI